MKVDLTIEFKGVKHVGDSLNKITRGEYLVHIGHWSFDYSCSISINDENYSEEYIELNIALCVYDNLNYYREFNEFQDYLDIEDFADEFGYTEIKKVLEIVNEIKQISDNLINKDEISNEFLSDMMELYSDGEPELILSNKDKILKYIEIERM